MHELFLLRFGLYSVGVLACLLVASLTTLVLWTLTLATISWWRLKDPKHYHTALYAGTVCHTRFRPVIHAFRYPIFFACIDLAEAPELFLKKKSVLWPFTNIIQFRPEEDHFKNGEGLAKAGAENHSLLDRVFRLVSERTSGKFQPSSQTHSIMLLTHLRYYGYCFNPVSFYYIVRKQEDATVDCIVTEVSNTPWNEMHVYVLHRDSVDVTSVHTTPQRRLRAVFPKIFHVSPFMEMNYVYDWTFDEQFLGQDITVQAKMIPQTEEDNSRHNDHAVHFTASFDIRRTRQQLSPIHVAVTLLQFPVYCAIVQLWIHYQALKLFAKGVTFIPHPEGAETAASRAIASIMTPFFTLKDWIQERRNHNNNVRLQDEEKNK